MNHNRLFNALIVAALVLVAALTARQAVATAQVVSAAAVTSPAPHAAAEGCPFSAEERQALRAAYVSQGGGWVARTSTGAAAGVEDGLLALRGCGTTTAATSGTCPFSVAERRALRAAYAAQGGGWVTRNGSTAAGVEGGLLALRGCGR